MPTDPERAKSAFGRYNGALMFTFIAIASAIGFMLGRIPGAVIGALAGYVLAQYARKRLSGRGLGAIQTRFLDTTFAVMGAMCKADGQVTHDEIQVAEKIFDRLRLSGAQRDKAKAAFNRGKATDFDLDAEVAQFRQATRGNRVLLQLFLQLQLSAIAADGVLHDSERSMLLRLARNLGLSEQEVQRLEAMLRTGTSAQSPQKNLDDAYRVLGVANSANNDEVKKAYRRLMSQNHPDKLASQGLPESMREIAEERTREIRDAYDSITAARNCA